MGGGSRWAKTRSSSAFYRQGAYFAEQASHSHHEKYVYRSTDEAGEHQCDTGKYNHLLVVNVLRGKPLKTAEVGGGRGLGQCRASWARVKTPSREARTGPRMRGATPLTAWCMSSTSRAIACQSSSSHTPKWALGVVKDVTLSRHLCPHEWAAPEKMMFTTDKTCVN